MKRVADWLMQPFAKLYRRFFDPRFGRLEAQLAELIAHQLRSDALERLESHLRHLIVHQVDRQSLQEAAGRLEGHVKKLKASQMDIRSQLEARDAGLFEQLAFLGQRVRDLDEDVNSLLSHLARLERRVEEMSDRFSIEERAARDTTC